MEFDKLAKECNSLLRKAQFAHNYGNYTEAYDHLGTCYDLLTDEFDSVARATPRKDAANKQKSK